MPTPFEELLDPLLDADSFTEELQEDGDVVRIGRGDINGSPVMVVAVDPDGRKGSTAQLFGKFFSAYDAAEERGWPIVQLFENPGVHLDISSMFTSEFGVGGLYRSQAALRGRVLQVCGVYGQLFSARAFPVALSDASVWHRKAAVALCPPPLVAELIGERSSLAALGGVAMHSKLTGLATEVVRSRRGVGLWLRRYLGYWLDIDATETSIGGRQPELDEQSLRDLIPEHESKQFPIMKLVRTIADADSVLELHGRYAPEMRILLARLDGRPVGILANDASRRGGILFPESCRKAAAFIRLAEAHGLPLLFLVDTPGFMVGADAEQGGILQAAAELYEALALARCRRVSVLVRRAYSAGFYAMCGSPFRPDELLALPTAKLAVFGPTLQERLSATMPAGAPEQPIVDPLEVATAVETSHELRRMALKRLYPSPA